MPRYGTDELLDAWDAVADSVERPAAPPAPEGGSPGLQLAVAAVVVLVAATMILLQRPVTPPVAATPSGPAGEATPSSESTPEPTATRDAVVLSPSPAPVMTPSGNHDANVALRTFSVLPGVGCDSMGIDDPLLGTLAGDPDDPSVAWLVEPDGERREIVWPNTFVARFEPQLALYELGASVQPSGLGVIHGVANGGDPSGFLPEALVARAGDRMMLSIERSSAAGTAANPYVASGAMVVGRLTDPADAYFGATYIGCHGEMPASGPLEPGTLVTVTAEGAPAMTIRIEDHGVLASWRAATADEVRAYAPPAMGSSIALVGAEGEQHLLIWVGSVCDRAGTLRAGPGWLELIPDPRPGCDAMAVGRALMLTFEPGVDPRKLQVVLRPTYLLEGVDPAAGDPLGVALPDDIMAGEWWLDPAAEAPASGSVTIRALLRERACASGRSPLDRVVDPVVVYQADAITVTIPIRIRPGEDDCTGNPAVPYLIELREPIGDRRLLDGSTRPPRDARLPPD